MVGADRRVGAAGRRHRFPSSRREESPVRPSGHAACEHRGSARPDRGARGVGGDGIGFAGVGGRSLEIPSCVRDPRIPSCGARPAARPGARVRDPGGAPGHRPGRELPSSRRAFPSPLITPRHGMRTRFPPPGRGEGRSADRAREAVDVILAASGNLRGWVFRLRVRQEGITARSRRFRGASLPATHPPAAFANEELMVDTAG